MMPISTSAWRGLALAAALLATSAAAHEPAAGRKPVIGLEPGVATEAAAVVDAFHAALASADQKAAAALILDETVIFEGGAVERSKAEYAAHHLPADAAFAASTKGRTTARQAIVAGELAVVMSEGRTAGTYKGRTIDQFTTETMTLRRVGDAWRIAHIHWSSRPAK